ncbi:MAG: M48 family metallopeptidase [Bdellovibrionales bacterium]|nr:M48 family metallopeptidase [Bdellovibrionales bacterium]
MKNAIQILTVLLVIGCATSPTGRRQLLLVSDGEMSAMGEQAFDEMKSKVPREHGSAVNAYVKCVANAVTSVASDHTGVASWEVVVFQDKSANAFALPGGKIGVHTGMLKVATSADQLAAVLGHEVGHVIARHGAERVSQAMAAQAGLLVTDALLETNRNRGTIMAALGVGTQFGVILPHGRKQESEADDVGQQLMAMAGFDPQESVQLWRNMEGAGGGGPPEWLSTHPSNSRRIKDLESNMAQALNLYQQARAAGRSPRCIRP